jgi:hypothetical protein
MDLLFVSPVLAELDALESEVLACTVWQDVRPCGGVAGLCDWRLAGTISDLLRRGALRGEPGEVMLIPGRPRLSFDKILLFGAGERHRFDEACYRDVMQTMLDTIGGRQGDVIAAERAADMLLEIAARDDERRHDVWTLIEDTAARRRIEQHMIEERRRVRRTE